MLHLISPSFPSGLTLRGWFNFSLFSEKETIHLTLLDPQTDKIKVYGYSPGEFKFNLAEKTLTVSKEDDCYGYFSLILWTVGEENASLYNIAHRYDGIVIGITDHPAMKDLPPNVREFPDEPIFFMNSSDQTKD